MSNVQNQHLGTLLHTEQKWEKLQEKGLIDLFLVHWSAFDFYDKLSDICNLREEEFTVVPVLTNAFVCKQFDLYTVSSSFLLSIPMHLPGTGRSEKIAVKDYCLF